MRPVVELHKNIRVSSVLIKYYIKSPYDMILSILRYKHNKND